MVTDDQLRKHKGLVYSIVNKLEFIPEGIDKEDLEQIGMLELWEAMKVVSDTEEGFSSYCCTRIKREILDYCRKVIAKKRRKLDEFDTEPYSEGIESEVFDSIFLKNIKEKLDSKDYRMLIARYIDNCTWQEIAAGFSITVVEVKSNLQRIRRQLVKTLKEDGTYETGDHELRRRIFEDKVA
jgi:RNA polymerase sigma factor (sigma-70 family)